MEIQQTTDYGLFHLINGNRNIVERKVKRIVDDVKNGLNLFPYCPIVVSDNPDKKGYNIIDGQHRFTASKRLGHPINFVVANETIQLNNYATAV